MSVYGARLLTLWGSQKAGVRGRSAGRAAVSGFVSHSREHSRAHFEPAAPRPRSYGSRIYRLQGKDAAAILEEKNAFTVSLPCRPSRLAPRGTCRHGAPGRWSVCMMPASPALCTASDLPRFMACAAVHLGHIPRRRRQGDQDPAHRAPEDRPCGRGEGRQRRRAGCAQRLYQSRRH